MAKLNMLEAQRLVDEDAEDHRTEENDQEGSMYDLHEDQQNWLEDLKDKEYEQEMARQDLLEPCSVFDDAGFQGYDRHDDPFYN